MLNTDLVKRYYNQRVATLIARMKVKDMHGLWLEDQELTFRTELEIPKVISDEVLVKVRLAGICNTDLELLKGYYPFTGVPGHEFVGEVSIPGNSSLVKGQRVVGEINAACGKCLFCLAGISNHCERRTVLGIVRRNGAFAEYLALPAENLRTVPDSLADEEAVFVEPLAAALEILEQVQLRPRMRVLLIGAGKLGQLIARTVSLSGAELIVSARHEWQKQLLRGLNIVSIPEDALPTRSIDIVIEATGSSEGLSAACRAVRPRGTVVLKSTYHGTAELDFSSIVVDEVTLVGSRCGPFSPALRLLEEGRVTLEGLVEDMFPLRRGLEAFKLAAKSGARKVLLKVAE